MDTQHTKMYKIIVSEKKQGMSSSMLNFPDQSQLKLQTKVRHIFSQFPGTKLKSKKSEYIKTLQDKHVMKNCGGVTINVVHHT